MRKTFYYHFHLYKKCRSLLFHQFYSVFTLTTCQTCPKQINLILRSILTFQVVLLPKLAYFTLGQGVTLARVLKSVYNFVITFMKLRH